MRDNLLQLGTSNMVENIQLYILSTGIYYCHKHPICNATRAPF